MSVHLRWATVKGGFWLATAWAGEEGLAQPGACSENGGGEQPVPRESESNWKLLETSGGDDASLVSPGLQTPDP